VEAENVPRHIPPIIGISVYRIVQEALRNVAKHANAAAVAISVVGQDDVLRLTIHDNGPGFSPNDVRFRGGLGLISMQERASVAGGSFCLTSKPGEGTTIQVEIPLAATERDESPASSEALDAF
jgi:signal transduction histidine kinase